jgi:hypothetical protein
VAAAHFANGTGTIAVTAALLATNTRDLQSIRHLSPDVEHRTMGAKGSNANAIASKSRLPGYLWADHYPATFAVFQPASAFLWPTVESSHSRSDHLMDAIGVHITSGFACSLRPEGDVQSAGLLNRERPL